MVDRRVFIERAQEAKRDRDRHREEHAMENKLKRSRKSLKKISGHGLGGGVGGPYITLSDEVGYVEVKLLVKRKVEAGLALHGLALFL
jgi:hypothetical protein